MSHKVKVDWSDDEFDQIIDYSMDAGMQAVAAKLQREFRIRMGSEGGGVVGKTKSGRNIYRASPPGSYPGVRTGFLMRSLQYWRATATGDPSLTYRVGVPAGYFNTDGSSVGYYAWILDQSTNPKMRRPWAMRTVRSVQNQLSTIFAKAATRKFESLSAASKEGGSK